MAHRSGTCAARKEDCGARTEAETLTTALREIVERDEIDRTFRRHGPSGAG
jgi:hypothetical protein